MVGDVSLGKDLGVSGSEVSYSTPKATASCISAAILRLILANFFSLLASVFIETVNIDHVHGLSPAVYKCCFLLASRINLTSRSNGSVVVATILFKCSSAAGGIIALVFLVGNSGC